MSRTDKKAKGAEPGEKKSLKKSVVSWFVEEDEDEIVEEAAEYPEDATIITEVVNDEVTAAPAEAAVAVAEAAEAEEPATEEMPGKDGKPKKEKKAKKDKAARNAEGKKKRRVSGWLIFLLILIVLVGGLLLHIHLDTHNAESANRGTFINDSYYYYLEGKDQIVKYSTSRGPRIIRNDSEEFPKIMAKLHPADRSASWGEYKDVVAEAMGSSFRASDYKYIGYSGKMVLFSHPKDGKNALWIYSERSRTAEPIIVNDNIRGIDFGNNIVYTRDDEQDLTVCYRISTSYSGQMISVDPFRNVSKSPVTFWTTTMADFVKGLVKGLKASSESK